MTDSSPINPYAAPQTASEAVSAETILQSVLQSIPALSYSTVVTRADIWDAIGNTSMRPDVMKKKSMVTLLFYFIVLMLMFGYAASSRRMTIFVILAAAVLFGVVRWLSVRRLVNAASSNLGPSEGCISPDGIVIKRALQTLYYRLETVVAVTQNRRRVVFVFDQSMNHFETVKFSDFDQPLLAERTFADLQKLLPPPVPVLLDERRQATPMEVDHFAAGKDALFFDGPIHSDDLRGSSFDQTLRNAFLWLWIRLVIYGVLAGTIVFLLVDLTLLFWMFVAFAVIFVCLLWYRLRKFKKTVLGKNELLWKSRGWIEADAMVHVSAIGQSRSAWALFEKPEVREHSIVFKYQTGPLWMVINRQQFQSDEAWLIAKQRIVEYLGNGTSIESS